MNYGDLESLIVSRLSAMSNVETAVAPDNEAGYKSVTNKGKIFVAFDMADDGESRSLGSVDSFDETIKVRLVIEAKSRIGAGGIYAIQEATAALLVGYRPEGFEKLAPKSYKYRDRQEGVWIYDYTFETSYLRVELPDNESLVLASRITLTCDNETIVVEKPTE